MVWSSRWSAYNVELNGPKHMPQEYHPMARDAHVALLGENISTKTSLIERILKKFQKTSPQRLFQSVKVLQSSLAQALVTAQSPPLSMGYTPFLSGSWLVACQTISKHLGIGSADRSWSDVKTIKNGNWAYRGGQLLEQRAIFDTSAKLEEAQILRNLDA